MRATPVSRVSRSLAKFPLGFVVLAMAARFGFVVDRTLRPSFLPFRLSDYVVPICEAWRLSWSSPYLPGDICPAYDVRIFSGSARVGKYGEVEAQTVDVAAENLGMLDFAATNGSAVVWLKSGTKFSIANERLQIEVGVRPHVR